MPDEIGIISKYASGMDLVVEWKIDKFFNLPEEYGAGHYSPNFSFGGERWWLSIFQNGPSVSDSSGHVVLRLCKINSARSIKQSFSLSLKTAKGEKYNEQHGTKDFDDDFFVHRFNRFIQRTELSRRRSELVPEGDLTVICTMKSSASAGSAGNTASTSDKCCHCKKTFNAQNLSSHQRKCMHRLIKCPDCLEVVVLKKWLDEHKCQKERSKDYNCREKLLMALCIVSILIAIVTGCALAYCKTPLSSSHPCGEGVNETLDAELKKADQSENAGSDIPEASAANQADTAKTDESEAATKIQTSEINNVDNRSDVVARNEFEASGSNETSATDIKEYEGVNKTLAAEFNKADQSENAGSDIPEFLAANQAHTAETDESDPLPQPVLMVTEVGSTYLEVIWVLPEESKSNAAHINYVVQFRKYGAQWQEVSLPEASRTSYSLTNLDPGMSYQIYVMAVDSSGFSRRSETATVRTSNKVIFHNSPKGHEKQFVLYAAAIIILIIVIACVYEYSKTSLSATHPGGEETQTISAEEDNIIKADLSEVAEANESEASDSKTCPTEIEGPVSFKNQPEDYGFVTDINHLLTENRGLDVTFELETLSGKTKLFAHQLILAVMSSYFADEFYDKGRNKGHQVIVLKGINPKAFEQMIRYCYDEKPIFKTTEEACVLFKIASEFKVISLQNLCCNFFRHTKINPGNAFSILEISEEMEDKSLKDKCRKILQDKTREFMASYELRDVTPAMVHILLDLPSLSLDSEYELIKWIFDWAKVKSEDKDSSCRSTRDYLAKLLQNINFLALTVEEFAILSRENPKVFNSDERASISLNIACPGSWEMPVWYNKDLKRRVYTGSIE